MATMIRYEPWPLHRSLVNEVNRVFASVNGGNASSTATADWTPPVDIEEYADKFVIYADVPGVDPASIEITQEKGVLTLTGTRERAAEQSGVVSRRAERSTGRFSRRFTLPDTVDGESVAAQGKLGALEITIPKRPVAQPRRITVSH